MTIRPIDKALKELERRADLIDFALDEDESYIYICSVVSDMDFGIMPDYHTKKRVFDLMEGVCKAVKIDFRLLMQRLILEGCE